ncbi:hypothetical protein RRG08_040970 [Elysia crispata]|uniref:Uncharacterized protein n=1 Tax=Elysia crispata TaxID=231223 RepID=A0AAE1E0Q6_9GAST|nr:hypothetical protein RRG08_040970 [Elysia crispata]
MDDRSNEDDDEGKLALSFNAFCDFLHSLFCCFRSDNDSIAEDDMYGSSALQQLLFVDALEQTSAYLSNFGCGCALGYNQTFCCLSQINPDMAKTSMPSIFPVVQVVESTGNVPPPPEQLS